MNLAKFLSSDSIVASHFAEKIGVPAPLLSQWRTGKRRVPAERVLSIEAATGGKVTRHELRPDIFGPAPKPMCATPCDEYKSGDKICLTCGLRVVVVDDQESER